MLAAAVDVPTSVEAEELARAHVHGFHSYPARMHPLTARRLVEAFSAEGACVLDPFAGSGTVLVEARLAGREAVGVDANPLAVRLAWLKVRGVGAEARARLASSAREVAALADARRKAKSGPSHRYGREDMALFQPHVLFELDSLRQGIDAIGDSSVRGDLELVLSSILIKLSRKASDTSSQGVDKRLAAGYAARLFAKKTEELTARLELVAEPLARAPAARVFEGDARSLAGVATGSIDLAVTSPPYPGNYDYLEQHAARLRWLRLRPERFDQAEIGARRHLDPLGPAEGRARFRSELSAALRALERALRPDGAAIFLLADSLVAGAPVFADDLVRSIAPEAGLWVRAVASQPRPHFHAPSARAFERRPRHEHAILLARAPRVSR